jgi:hypothetical protein
MKSTPRRKSVRKKQRAVAQGNAARARLRGSVLKYEKPTDPVIEPREWNAGGRP